MTDAADDFLAHVNQLAANAGIELDDEDLRAIFEESQAGGFNASATEAAFDSHFDWDDDFDDDEEFEETDGESESGTDRLIRHTADDVKRIEAEAGRPLTRREHEIIAHGVLEQADRFDQVNAQEALDDHYRLTRETRPDTSTDAGRGEFYRQRLAESQPDREVPDEIDMTTPEGRGQYYDARLNGGLGADDFEDAND